MNRIYCRFIKRYPNPEMIDGAAINDIIRTLEVAREMRKKPGHIGESVKLTIKAQGKLLKRGSPGTATSPRTRPRRG